MSDDKNGSSDKKEYREIVSSSEKPLKSFDDLRKPNAYLNDWTQVATKGQKSKSSK